MKKLVKFGIYLICTTTWLIFISNALAEEATLEISDYITVDVSRVDVVSELYKKIEREKYLQLERLLEEEMELKRIEQERLIRMMRLEEEKRNIEEEKLRVEAENKRVEAERVARIEKEKQAQEIANSSTWAVYELTFYNLDYASTGKDASHPAFGITASGTTATVGRTIACPKSIPLGTKLYIEGFGDRVCEDRGGAIVGAIFDVLVSSRAEAYQLGRIKARVKFY